MVEQSLSVQDTLNIKDNPEIMSLLGQETVYYSSKIKKFTRFDWTKERNIIVTSQKVYSFKKNDMRRSFQIVKLLGITKSLNDQAGELVLHIKGEYDYRIKCDQRDQIIKTIQKIYAKLTQSTLPFYGVVSHLLIKLIKKPKSLSEFTTSKKDLKKGISRIPLEMSRIKSEDIEEDIENLINSEEDLDQETYKASMKNRESAYAENRIPTSEEECKQVLIGRQKSLTLYAKKRDMEVTLDDFQVKQVIGQGSFGKVYMVKQQKTEKIFAMKSIRKDVVIDSEQLENLRLEKHIMLCVEHPFIISMEYVFQRDLRIYFLMDFINGGELFRYLSAKKRLNEDEARFYGAQVALALGYLHESRIIYRDLKPENILINDDGYIKLADFGLAKMLGEEVANSFCGTPEYLAPEMINGSGHDQTLDWWTLGILLYEMIVGIPPFYNQNKHKMYQLIEQGSLKWPTQEKHGFSVSSEAQDLIKALLCKDKMKRLGRENDVEELLNHPWFKKIDSQQLLKKKIIPPYKPQLKNKDDTSNFDEKYKQLEIAESIISPGKVQLIEKHKEDFETF